MWLTVEKCGFFFFLKGFSALNRIRREGGRPLGYGHLSVQWLQSPKSDANRIIVIAKLSVIILIIKLVY